LTAGEAGILIAGGLAAGVVNTLAGGGSLISVPLLVLVGLPGTIANGTNRIGVFLQNLIAAWRFRAQGVSGLEGAAKVVVPVCLGSLVGAYTVANLSDAVFQRIFGAVMLIDLIPMLRPPKPGSAEMTNPWPRWLLFAVFMGIGLYGGAIQAGVGLLMVGALNHTGYDLIRANSIKVATNVVLTAFAIPIFVWKGQVAWAYAGVLAIGFAAGGAIGAQLAVRGGERVIRPVMVLAIVALAGRMLGFY
jgi:uncharacterized membrane protein YfcA